MILLHRSGQSIFSRPKPIDINAARRAGFGMELDIESDEEDELNRPLVGNPIVFDVEANGRSEGDQASRNYQDMPRAVHAARNRDTQDIWADVG
jgi:hypothetical protein